ncbi:hypothetical protein MNEG_12254 [Monoraphidium neglectum]|uniref:Uncharacterized protein n=1 Tax=Monoraphidium neglectum TaxID=145388 RepID=A0A0D2M313_9CHLO|nr:hypothetical protein MNEG_12254 [Monoraphidium neglectum]KIY95706.1 hypothetical protein MNEG_12254 [Monoraphidium neglectum]|eukprot:XP_013894726.1 hypothetical protein MNEG_12254 [Monoraphidium neglectum]
MACTRLQQWAFGDGGLRDIWAQLPEQGQALFKLLRGASDLLMMPKDMLLDDDIREETHAAAAGAGAGAGAAAPRLELEAECIYYSPTDDMTMERVEVGEEPGLEFGSESEDELAAVGNMGADLGAAPPLRFRLLARLWHGGVPRPRRVTGQRAE